MSFNLSASPDEISFYPFLNFFLIIPNNITFSMITAYVKSIRELELIILRSYVYSYVY